MKFVFLLAMLLPGLAFTGCNRADTSGGIFHKADAAPDARETPTFRIMAAPTRQLDLVFVLDNSPSTCTVNVKMEKQFPNLIAALKDPATGTLPDLRIALLDGDLGTGGAYTSGSCGAKTLGDGTYSRQGDLGRFQMTDATNCGVTKGSWWLEFASGPVNYAGDISTVFNCLADKLCQGGCSFQQPLQALEYALVGKGIGNDEQQKMLRPHALLGLVILAAGDDCSAAGNFGLFQQQDQLRAETSTLRCATRGHYCNGNLTDFVGYPTEKTFTTKFSDCIARYDPCPNPIDGDGKTDTADDTACSPLRSVGRSADSIKGLKRFPDQQILVAGIFGWPVDLDALATAEYRIGKVPNPDTKDPYHSELFELWPVCYDPNSQPKDSGYDATAWGPAAAPGLRIASYIDEFHGLKRSACQPDYADSMTEIGRELAKRMQNRCLPAKFKEYSTCTARFQVPDGRGNYDKQSAIPRCDAGKGGSTCYTLTTDSPSCAAGETLVSLESTPNPATGTLLEFACN